MSEAFYAGNGLNLPHSPLAKRFKLAVKATFTSYGYSFKCFHAYYFCWYGYPYASFWWLPAS